MILSNTRLLPTRTARRIHALNSNLPVFVVETEGDVFPGDTDVNATIEILNSGYSRLATPIMAERATTIATRGQTSAYPAVNFKQYKMKFASKTIPFPGWMNHDGFILQSEVFDRTSLMNRYAYYLANQLGAYGVKTIKGELILNGEYRGVYTFEEKIKYDRIGIAKASSTDPNKGYITKIDAGEDGGIYTDMLNRFWEYEYPQLEDVTPAQTTFLKSLMDTCEDRLFGTGWDDPVTGWRSVFDAASMAACIILNEFSCTPDGYSKSFYLSRTTSGKFKYVAWDFDLSWGECRPDWLGIIPVADEFMYLKPGYLPRLQYIPRMMADADFVENTLKPAYAASRAGVLSDVNVASWWATETAALSQGAIQRQQIKRENLTTDLHGFLNDAVIDPPITYEVEIQRMFDGWMGPRLSFLDSEWL